MPLPDAMVRAAVAAAHVSMLDANQRGEHRDYARVLIQAAFAWLHSDAPEAVEARTRMGTAFWDAWNDRDHPDAADAVAMAAALAELAGDA